MEFHPHPMEARSTKQVHGSKKQKPSSETINLDVEKKHGSSTNTCRSQKKYPHRVQKTHKEVPHIFCDPSSKKNSVRSKKHVQVQKKGAQVQKICIPFLFRVSLKIPHSVAHQDTAVCSMALARNSWQL